MQVSVFIYNISESSLSCKRLLDMRRAILAIGHHPHNSWTPTHTTLGMGNGLGDDVSLSVFQ